MTEPAKRFAESARIAHACRAWLPLCVRIDDNRKKGERQEKKQYEASVPLPSSRLFTFAWIGNAARRHFYVNNQTVKYDKDYVWNSS
jgi:hypothetical protein